MEASIHVRRRKEAPAIPGHHDGDGEDVRWALSAAETLWKRGEEDEALRWLRRAAETAADHDEVRAVELFERAAEVAAYLDRKHPPRPRRPRVPRFGVEENEEDTFIRPEEMLRRALVAIDPDYARRTAYEEDEARRASGPALSSRALETLSSMIEESARPPRFYDDDDDDPQGETVRRRQDLAIAGSLPAVRVAVLPIPDEGDVRLVFLSPGVAAPEGVATALLVPTTENDAQRLAQIYAEARSKL